MIALVELLSLLGILVGLISVAVPLRFLRIDSRRMALVVVATCTATFVAALNGPARSPSEATKMESADTQRTLASPTVDDGCQLAGAVANCKEEVAKIAAAKATNPTFNQSDPAPTKQANGSNSARNYVDDMKNKMKAEEASANVKALAAQREYEAAKFRLNNSLEAGVSNYDAASQRYKLEHDSLTYDLRIRERERERQSRGY